MEQFVKKPEAKNKKTVPLTAVTKDALQFYRVGNLSAVLQSWGFEIHHPAFTSEVIEDFLATRYGYWEDDVQHEAVFGL